jgi:hypothetical protein
MMEMAALLEVLFALYGRRAEPLQAKAYKMALADVPLDALTVAVEEAMRTCKFLPTPAELRDLAAGGNAEERGMAAWILLNRAIRQVGPYCSLLVADHALARAIEDVFGGWPEANSAAGQLNEPAWQAKRKEFVLAYKIQQRTPATAPRAYLPGIADRSNQQTRFMWERNAPSRYWIGALEADGRIVVTPVPYNSSGRPELSAISTLSPPRALPPPPLHDVPGETKEVFLERFEAAVKAHSLEAPSRQTNNDAHYDLVQRQIDTWRSSEENADRARVGEPANTSPPSKEHDTQDGQDHPPNARQIR